MGLTFSKEFGIKLNGQEEWFDPCLFLDSPLCLDPFLMFDLEEEDEFKGAHDEIVKFFQHQFLRIAHVGLDVDLPNMRPVIQALHMPEVKELYLGYSEGISGAGFGNGLAKLMVRAIIDSIKSGLANVQHFEEISILGNGIGPDRISDAVAGITKWRFASYTERVCLALGVPTKKHFLDRAKYDFMQDRWVTISANLPTDPRTKRSILLTPQRFLRHLPTLGREEFADYAERKWKDQHREDLEKKLVSYNRDKVLEAARKNSGTRNEFIVGAKTQGGESYDFSRDRWGIKMPDVAAKVVANNQFSFTPPTNDEEMKQFVLRLAKYFKHFIEQQKGWELLWDGDQAKAEKAVQRLMFGIVFLICADKNISVDPETNAGRGPVDFKFSSGFNAKCLLETKLTRNTKWFVSVVTQLPTYVVSDVGKYGVYLLVAHDNVKAENIEKLQIAAQSIRPKGIEIDVIVVDASRNKPSASKLQLAIPNL